MRLMDTELTRWRRIRVVAALIGAVLGALVVVLAVLPGTPYLPDGVEFIPFVMAFPLFGWAVIERAQTRARRKGNSLQERNELWSTSNDEANRAWAQLFKQAYRYRVLLIIGIPLVIVMWALMLYSVTSLQGQPEHVGNHYFLTDHGSEITVNKAGYASAIAKQQLLFAAGGSMFLIVSAGMTLTFDPKRGSGDLTL
jgi:hypothetical protein